MTEALGRREASKQATRAALLSAAKRLFAEHGFDATTVRDIAAAARVTERTFYRYFDGKEGLVAEEFLSWLGTVGAAIAARPAAEPPAIAVHRALIDVGREAAVSTGPLQLWLFSGGQRSGIRRFAPRPLMQLEFAIADAVLARAAVGETDRLAARGGGEPGPTGGDGARFRARVVSRAAVAALRSAVIEYRELAVSEDVNLDALKALLDEAFAVIGAEFGAVS
ncbi:MAG TPA: helix-turn-helix domain-containing protein [Streptosporangiaceae bacterium]